MREIAAVTFTEKAAAELRDRIRRALESVGATTTRSPRPAPTLALEELDAAAVSTLHAFAQRILAEHPVEAGLPPRVQVLDDIASQLAFEERWTRFVDELLDDPALERTILLALNADTTLAVLRTLALACNAELGPRRRAHARGARPTAARARARAGARRAREMRARAAHCLADDDKLLAEGSSTSPSGTTRCSPRPTSTSSCACSTWARPTGERRHGQEDNWPDDCTVDDVRAEVRRDRGPWSTELAAPTSETVVRRLAWELAQFTLREAAARRAAGELEFHDLLVLARAMLRDPEHGWDVRQRLRARYTPPAARRVPGHRPDPVRPRRAARVGRARRARPPRGTSCRSTPAACSSWATPSSRSTGSGGPTSPRSSRARVGVRRRRRATSPATSAPPRR